MNEHNKELRKEIKKFSEDIEKNNALSFKILREKNQKIENDI